MAISKRLGIKSIQRGVLTLAYPDVSTTATIAAVDTSKTEVHFLGVKTSGSALASGLARLWLTNSTTVGAVVSNNGTPGVVTEVTYQVVEWY